MSRKGFKPIPKPKSLKENYKEKVKEEKKEEKKVGLVFEYDRTGETKIIDMFIFDLSRLEETISFVRKERADRDLSELRDGYRKAINNTLEKPPTAETQELFRTIIINYLCSFNSPKDWITKYPGKSVGFIFNQVDNEDNPKIMAVDMPAFELMVERTIKKK